MELTAPYIFQDYEVFIDNYYSSPAMFGALLEVEVCATGTLHTNRTGVPISSRQSSQSLRHHVVQATISISLLPHIYVGETYM